MDIKERVEEVAARSPWGWGHPIKFGEYTSSGLLGNLYLEIVERLDSQGWLPVNLSGLRVADVGCFSGGITKILAERGAEIVYAIDEIPEHLEQAALVKGYFDLHNVELVGASLYQLPKSIEPNSLDLILCSGVLYHLSDMLVGLLTLHDLLKSDGVLLIESNAVDDNERSYANFGRFAAGMWWQPSTLCISDMCKYMGFERPEIDFYHSFRCLAKTTKSDRPIPFKRGINFPFEDIHDLKERTTEATIMRPARD